MTGQPTFAGPRTPRNSRPYDQGLKNPLFPLRRLAIKPLFLRGGGGLVGWLAIKRSWQHAISTLQKVDPQVLWQPGLGAAWEFWLGFGDSFWGWGGSKLMPMCWVIVFAAFFVNCLELLIPEPCFFWKLKHNTLWEFKVFFVGGNYLMVWIYSPQKIPQMRSWQIKI